MTQRRYVQIGGGVVLLALLVWGVNRGLERLIGARPTPQQGSAASTGPAPGVPRITATLFYGSADGQALVPIRREVALAEGVVPQAREILRAQLEAVPAPHLTVIPTGTSLRAFYVTDRGDAFVDLSGEASSGHAGGATTELLTVYAIVNAVTSNLPGIQRVQILIDGHEADTLAGHVDLRRPLQPDQSLVRTE